MRRQPHEVDAPGTGGLACGEVPGIVAALEADLHVRALRLDALRERDARRERIGQRLLAQDVEPGVERRLDRRAVQLGRGRDDDRVGHLDRAVEAQRRAARALGDLVGAIRIGVDHVQAVHLVHRAEQVGVRAAHAAGADDGDLHRSSSRSA